MAFNNPPAVNVVHESQTEAVDRGRVKGLAWEVYKDFP